ncbi:MAG: sigma-70 family RNA polymerase sigma factor, partial [Actinomycetota bacterium]|nr:sigma-70 family RNA polymerase sigma factor [Actinomycetota bacterium]
MEASALSHAARRGLLTRKSPLLKMQGDERLVALVRSGNSGAFDIIVDRYQARLLGFCRQMVGSTEDAEDVLQEVFVNAHKAILADNREINLRPWLYRIARNRSLNHLRKPKAVAQESMDLVPMTAEGGTAEKVHNREEFRQLLQDVTKLPETQRAALLLREIDALSYEEIAEAMDTTVPSVKSLLVRARISLAEASQARMLTCGEVRVELAEAAEGLAKASGPVRRHVRDCEECSAFRKQLRSDTKTLAMLMPVGPLLALKGLIAAKLGLGGGAGASAGAGAGAAAVGGATATTGGAIGAGGAASGIGAVTGAVGSKALAGVVTAAVLTAGAVEVKRHVVTGSANEGVNPTTRTVASTAAPVVVAAEPAVAAPAAEEPITPAEADPVEPTEPVTPPAEPAAPVPPAETAPAEEPAVPVT